MRLFRSLIAAIIMVLWTDASHAEDRGFFIQFDKIDPHFWYLSNGWANGPHQSCEWWKGAASILNGHLLLALNDTAGKSRPYTCPEVHTTARYGYGFYEARMRSAAGSGLNTAFFTFVGPPTGSPEHDEIDFEFLGKKPATVQTNYFTNGQRHADTTVQLGFDASKGLHDYVIEWRPDKIRWYVDGRQVFETPDGEKMPRNPGRLYLSLWSGAAMEDSWMGKFTYAGPYTADVAWTAYTPLGASCLFPESFTCKHH